MSLELKKAIDQISKDKGLDRFMLIETLEEAVRTSVARKYGEDFDVEVSFNEDTGELDVFQFKIVVNKVEDESAQIALEEAKKHDSSVQLDDEMGFRLKVEDLGRIAAQSAKQVIIQRMRDAEHEGDIGSGCDRQPVGGSLFGQV
jgi:N utilization substance protein A